MKQKHWLICLGLVGIIVAIWQFVPRANWGTAAIILICPAMHLLMMKGHVEHCKDYPPTPKATAGDGRKS